MNTLESQGEFLTQKREVSHSDEALGALISKWLCLKGRLENPDSFHLVAPLFLAGGLQGHWKEEKVWRIIHRGFYGPVPPIAR